MKNGNRPRSVPVFVVIALFYYFELVNDISFYYYDNRIT